MQPDAADDDQDETVPEHGHRHAKEREKSREVIQEAVAPHGGEDAERHRDDQRERE